MSTLVAVSREPTASVLVDLLDIINDVGTSVFAELNRAHFSLASLEGATTTGRGSPPSDRWYRLYEQMATRAVRGSSLSAGSQFGTLAAAVIFSEIADLELRARELARNSAREEVRGQVAAAASIARTVADVFLESAIRLLAGGDGPAHQQGAVSYTGSGGPSAASRTDVEQLLQSQFVTAVTVFSRTFLREQAEPSAPAKRSSTGSSAPTVDRAEERADRALSDLGAELRATRTETDIDQLAVAASTGERRAVDDLLRAIQRPVLHYCRARLGTNGATQPEDVAQEVLYAVCDVLPRYNPSSTPFMTTVFGIARHRVVDAYRAAGRDRCQPTAAVPDAIDTSAGPELLALQTVQAERLRSALEKLPEHHREVIVLRVALRYSAEEVARIQQTTPGAIRVAQFRAMKRLRRLLLDHKDAAASPE